MSDQNRRGDGSRAALPAVRYGLPAVIVATGVALAVLGTGEAVLGAGVVLVGVGLLVELANLLMRLGIESEHDRRREERARRHFGRHGRWPGRGLEP